MAKPDFGVKRKGKKKMKEKKHKCHVSRRGRATGAAAACVPRGHGSAQRGSARARPGRLPREPTHPPQLGRRRFGSAPRIRLVGRAAFQPPSLQRCRGCRLSSAPHRPPGCSPPAPSVSFLPFAGRSRRRSRPQREQLTTTSPLIAQGLPCFTGFVFPPWEITEVF